MKILIATEPDDIHALSVKLAIESAGHSCDLWFPADIPSLQMHGISISNENFDWVLKYEHSQKLMDDHFDVVWWRRPRKPYIPDDVNKNDAECIIKENISFYNSIPLILGTNAWWINPCESIKYANSKIYQLKQAPQFNLKIPPTLISNSPEMIKTFIKVHETVIYKSFCPHNWYENDILKFSYTRKVSLDHLPGDEMLQMTPGIFQKQINKQYELRVTCFGDYLVAVKIRSQENPKSLTDWRIAATHELKLEPYVLSSALAANIRNFMRHLGIVFGCFDFIATPDDEIYFLEVNEQGQFLWIEDILPEVRMLDIFVQFLLNKSSSFQWNPTPNPIQLCHYEDQVAQLAKAQMSQHVYLNGIKKTKALA